MKKLICLLLIASVLIPGLTRDLKSVSSSNSIKGESFIYEILTSDISVKVRRNQFSVDTFQIHLNQFSTNNTVDLVVDNFDDEMINYSLSCDDYQTNESSPFCEKYLDIHLFSYVSYYLINSPLVIPSHFVDAYDDHRNFTTSYYSKGFQLELVYFLPVNDTTWTRLEEISTTFNNNSLFATEFFTGLLQCNYTEVDDVIFIES